VTYIIPPEKHEDNSLSQCCLHTQFGSRSSTL